MNTHQQTAEQRLFSPKVKTHQQNSRTVTVLTGMKHSPAKEPNCLAAVHSSSLSCLVISLSAWRSSVCMRPWSLTSTPSATSPAAPGRRRGDPPVSGVLVNSDRTTRSSCHQHHLKLYECIVELYKMLNNI